MSDVQYRARCLVMPPLDRIERTRLPGGGWLRRLVGIARGLRDERRVAGRRSEETLWVAGAAMSVLDQLSYNDQGLIPAIVQDRLTGQVRMMAWMNRESLELTLSTRKATFFSRSRQKLWVKGEQSQNTLHVTDVLADCDRDTLLVLCDPNGPSCHTGQENCFFESLDGKGNEPARPLTERLEAVLEQRKQSSGEKSYTRSLFDGGAEKIGRKIGEEAGELVDALRSETDDRVLSEAADLFYHALVGLRLRGLPFRGVLRVLSERFGVGGHEEKAARKER